MNDLRKLWDVGFSVDDISDVHCQNTKAWDAHSYTSENGKMCVISSQKFWILPSDDAEVIFGEHYQRVIRYLIDGIWVAIGYQSPRTLSSPLVIIPSGIVAGMELDESHSSISGNGLSFVGVRFVHKSLLDKLDAPTTRPAGRPSKREQIAEAIQALIGEGDFDLSLKNQNGQFEIVRAKVNELYATDDPSNKGMGNLVIYSVLRERFS